MARDRNARMAELRLEGWTLEDIGAEYGVSRQRVEQILKRDHPEVREVAREERARRTDALHRCVDCGEWRPNGLASLRCLRCAGLARQCWTAEAIIDAIRDYADQYGRPPGAMDWLPGMARQNGRPDLAERFYADGCWPVVGTVQQRFGSWNAGIAAAGFEPKAPGRRYREAGPRWSREAIVGRLRRWAEIHDGEPPRASDWHRAVAINGEHFPTHGVVFARFGSWNAAMEAAGFTPRRVGRPRAS